YVRAHRALLPQAGSAAQNHHRSREHGGREGVGQSRARRRYCGPMGGGQRTEGALPAHAAAGHGQAEAKLGRHLLARTPMVMGRCEFAGPGAGGDHPVGNVEPSQGVRRSAVRIRTLPPSLLALSPTLTLTLSSEGEAPILAPTKNLTLTGAALNSSPGPPPK